jgi:hypothetical protein
MSESIVSKGKEIAVRLKDLVMSRGRENGIMLGEKSLSMSCGTGNAMLGVKAGSMSSGSTKGY